MGRIEEIAKIHHECLIDEFRLVGIDANINIKHLIQMWNWHGHPELFIDSSLHKINGQTVRNYKILGFVKYFDNEPMIYVDPKYQRSGIGSKLLNESVIDTVWVMKGNTKAENFYKKNGFEPTDSRETTKLGHDITEVKWVKSEATK